MKPQKFIDKIVNKATKFIAENDLAGYSVTGQVISDEYNKKIPYLILRFPNSETVSYNLKSDYDIHEEEDVSISQSFAYIKRSILHDIQEYNALRETESYNLDVESEEESIQDEQDEDFEEDSEEDFLVELDPFDEEHEDDEEIEEDDLEEDEDDYEDSYEEEDDEDEDKDEELEEDDDSAYSENWSDNRKLVYFADYDTDYASQFGYTMVNFLKWKLPTDSVSISNGDIVIGNESNNVSFNINDANREYQTNSMDFNEYGIELINRYRDILQERLTMHSESVDSSNEQADSVEDTEEYDDDYLPF